MSIGEPPRLNIPPLRGGGGGGGRGGGGGVEGAHSVHLKQGLQRAVAERQPQMSPEQPEHLTAAPLGV